MSKELPYTEENHHDDDVVTNTSNNPHMSDIIAAMVTRRDVLKGMSAVSAAFFGGSALTLAEKAQAQTGLTLGFQAVAKSLADTLTVPAGYTARVLYALGDPIADGVPAYANDGTDFNFAQRAGDHHDGMYYFGMNADGSPNRNSSKRGMLCMNHEALTTVYLHPNGPTTSAEGVRPTGQVRKEIEAHGVSIIEIAKNASGQFELVRSSPRNRRLTAATTMRLSGPARRSAQLITRFSPTGTRTRGTVNNCAEGFTPWGTYLTCEENYAGYFARPTATDDPNRSARELTAFARDGVNSTLGRFNWASAPGDRFERWSATVSGATAADDYRNVSNTFGWVVEVDPFDPTSVPVKRTALGRFAHEGCWPHLPPRPGQPVVFYMGDDSRGEYVFKFVSERRFSRRFTGIAAGNRYLDRGTLYVARFNADGTGTWLPLVFGQNGLDASNAAYPFADQADVLIHARLAGDALGATRMDRPEWATVDPTTGLVYLTLTNNSNRRIAPADGQFGIDSPNPRDYQDEDSAPGNPAGGGNRNGHIIRWREAGNDPTATSFTWEIFLFGAEADSSASLVNLSALDDSNDFSSPDGLWCDPRGVMWIQTDDGAYTDTTNCMMLAAVPGALNDGGLSGGARPDAIAVNGVTTYKGANPGASLRRFLVGPADCEITGVDITPDGRTMFVNIQHPGEGGSLAELVSTWPALDGVSRPRSTTVVITRDDGGVIGLA
ncbi:MAG: PhoX family protein [Panacagrimonas sp.]